jgi:hypothetical protein
MMSLMDLLLTEHDVLTGWAHPLCEAWETPDRWDALHGRALALVEWARGYPCRDQYEQFLAELMAIAGRIACARHLVLVQDELCIDGIKFFSEMEMFFAFARQVFTIEATQELAHTETAVPFF